LGNQQILVKTATHSQKIYAWGWDDTSTTNNFVSWFGLGCLVAWLIGQASDIGGAKDIAVTRKLDIDTSDAESPVFANQCRQVRIVLARE